MEALKYLDMNSEELYKYLISDIIKDPNAGSKLLEELSNTKRYLEEHEFRAYVDTGKAIVSSICGEVKKVSLICTELIERTAALNLWRLSAISWNTLGIAYFTMGIYERAIECFYNVVKLEKEHDINLSSSLAYHNIALIYMNLEEYEKSIEYFELSLEALEKAGKDQARYVSRYVNFSANLIISYVKIGQMKKAEEVFRKNAEFDADELLPASLYSIELAYMYYYFYLGEYEKAREAYYKTRDLIEPSNHSNYVSLLSGYLELCAILKLEKEFFINELLSVEQLEKSNAPLWNIHVFSQLREFYKEKGDLEGFERVTEKYIDILVNESKTVRELQLHSIGVIEALIRDDVTVSDITSKNTELRLLADEAIRNKNALEEANNRLAIINDLGRQLTSSLNLDEVTHLIYNNIKISIPIDTFVIMLVEKEHHRLRAVAAYFGDVLYPEFYLDLDHTKSMFVRCYRENEILFADERYDDKAYSRRTFEDVNEEKYMNSAIFMPLNVSGELIGVCSIQSTKNGVYTQKHIDFLRDLLPYLSIALNNALHSWRLQEEIQSHLKTQEQLEFANKRLEFISSLDSLTQISNRKDFDGKFKELLQFSKERSLPVTVFMMDIDNFKLYNDTYGHLAGDEALKSVAAIIRDNIEAAGGISARFGGEEFIAACFGLNLEKSIELAEKIRKDVLDLNIRHRAIVLKKLSISIGVAITYLAEPKHKSELMRWADVSLYRAKNSGKNKVLFKEVFLKRDVSEITE